MSSLLFSGPVGAPPAGIRSVDRWAHRPRAFCGGALSVDALAAHVTLEHYFLPMPAPGREHVRQRRAGRMEGCTVGDRHVSHKAPFKVRHVSRCDVAGSHRSAKPGRLRLISDIGGFWRTSASKLTGIRGLQFRSTAAPQSPVTRVRPTEARLALDTTKKTAAKIDAAEIVSLSVAVRSQRNRPRLTPATRARVGGPIHNCPTAQRLAWAATLAGRHGC